MRESPSEATEAVWSGVIGDCGAGVAHEGAAEPFFVGDDPLGTDFPLIVTTGGCHPPRRKASKRWLNHGLMRTSTWGRSEATR